MQSLAHIDGGMFKYNIRRDRIYWLKQRTGQLLSGFSLWVGLSVFLNLDTLNVIFTCRLKEETAKIMLTTIDFKKDRLHVE